MMSSVFHSSTYHHMVNSNNKLKFYAVPSELSVQAPNLDLGAVVPPPSKTDLLRQMSPNACKQLLVGSPSPRQPCNWSLMLDDYLPHSNWSQPRPNQTLPVLLRNKTPFTRLNRGIALRQRDERKSSHLSYHIKDFLLPRNNGDASRVKKILPKPDAPIQYRGAAKEQRQLQLVPTSGPTFAGFFDQVISKLRNIDVQPSLNTFVCSMQSLTHVLLNIAPIPQLSVAYNFLSALFEYFAIEIGNLLSYEILPRLRYYVVDPLIDRLSIYILKIYEKMDRGRCANRSFFDEVESKQNAFLLIITTPCQSCLQLYPGRYPSIADALPPKAIVPQRLRERFLMDCPLRQLLLLGVV